MRKKKQLLNPKSSTYKSAINYILDKKSSDICKELYITMSNYYKYATELIEKRLVAKLSAIEKIQIKMHTTVCSQWSTHENPSDIIEKPTFYTNFIYYSVFC